jgi:anti-sigma regulatory factor (Ser/Thr protein kinase)
MKLLTSPRRGQLVYFRNHDATIDLSRKINSYGLKDFCTAIEKFKSTHRQKLTVDFSRVLLASPGGVLPVICMLDALRDAGIQVDVRLPRNPQVLSLFEHARWSDFLTGCVGGKPSTLVGKHSVVRRFENAGQQQQAADDMMEIIVRNMDVPQSILSAAEWVFQETTGNVLNHSGSKFGGLAQVSVYPDERVIAFAIADSGKGVLSSMREGFPRMRADLQAIGEALKPGVSRAPKLRNGFGLPRVMEITTLTGGSFELTSGKGKVMAAHTEIKRKSLEPVYAGTVVCGQIRINRNFSLSRVMGSDGR